MIKREIREEVVRRYQNGEEIRKICAELGIKSIKTIYNILDDYGLSKRTKNPAKARPQVKKVFDFKLYDYYKKLGLSDTEIAKQFEMSRYTLHKRLKERRENNDKSNS